MMRMLRAIATVALGLVPVAAASQPPGAAEPQTGTTGSTGSFDAGVRATDVDGDSSRFERYRDLGDGLFLEELRLGREAKGMLFNFEGEHVGRRDQRLAGQADRKSVV